MSKSNDKPSKPFLQKLILVELALTGVFVYLGLTAEERPWARHKK